MILYTRYVATEKVILFLTDGEPTDKREVIMSELRKLNGEQNNRYTIITYGLGTSTCALGDDH